LIKIGIQFGDKILVFTDQSKYADKYRTMQKSMMNKKEEFLRTQLNRGNYVMIRKSNVIYLEYRRRNKNVK